MRDFREKGQIAPGEGERRAMRGYVPQYEFAARLIYDGLVSGKLQWVGLADRTAGAFDDVVLGLQDRVVGYQVKSSREPEPFRCRDLLLGARGLLDRFVETSIKLRAAYPGKIIQIAFVTDNFPSTADNLGAEAAGPISSAAFLRLHDARGNQWSLEEWRSSPFQKFIDELLKASGLSDEEFSALWKGVVFQVGGTHRYPGGHATTPFDDRRLADLSALLPRLVADRADRDRWTAEELLDRLRWPGPFNLRHEHAFPVDSLVQSNPTTEGHLKIAFDQALSGYVSLVGPPGSGKSTLLQAGLLPIPRAIFMRYLAFLPNERHGLGRAEAFDFLYDLVSQFKKQGLGDGIFPGSELPELRSQLERLLKAAGGRFLVEGVKTIIVIDGLDHVPREERPEHSFLRELPLPASIPTGVIFVLGTQRLDLDDIPPAVRDQAKEVGRQINIAPLPREAVYRLAEIAAVPDDVNRSILYERSEGHPLSVRYLVEALLRSSSEDERKDWLAANVAPGRDVTKLYVRAWHDLENQSEAKRALAYVALIEGAIASIELDKIVGSTATDAAFRAAAHLLKIDARNRISIFHNSFRLFLLEQTNTRLGRLDHAAVQLRYSELADMAKRAEPDDPQRWMELRYRARAQEIHAVLRLATPQFFRSQFADGRNPGDIHGDIRLAFGAVRGTREPEKLFELLLCRHEIEMRADAISVEALLGAYIAAGQLDVALGLIAAEGLSFPVTAHYPVVDALLSDGRFDDARRLFEEHEPIEKLLGSEPVDVFRSDEELPDWADHVLVFREPRHFLASLERLRKEERGWAEAGSLDDLKDHLKVRAARSRIEQAPERDFTSIVQSLEVDSSSFGPLRVLAAEAAYDLEREDDAIIHLRAAAIDCSEIHISLRRRAARLALALSQRDLAEAFFTDVPRPDLIRQTDHPIDWFVPACREVLIDGEIEAQLSVRAASR
ncbi:MAG TPA: hypothetical protein VK556_11830, partial [Candidatus Udaeobacter sp.]|nr:hypothetical protein [Candidatus Udaeobacter sp.]